MTGSLGRCVCRWCSRERKGSSIQYVTENWSTVWSGLRFFISIPGEGIKIIFALIFNFNVYAHIYAYWYTKIFFKNFFLDIPIFSLNRNMFPDNVVSVAVFQVNFFLCLFKDFPKNTYKMKWFNNVVLA